MAWVCMDYGVVSKSFNSGLACYASAESIRDDYRFSVIVQLPLESIMINLMPSPVDSRSIELLSVVIVQLPLEPVTIDLSPLNPPLVVL